MKQRKRKTAAAVSATLTALTPVGLSSDQAVARVKARKGAKARAGGNAKTSKTPGSQSERGRLR